MKQSIFKIFGVAEKTFCIFFTHSIPITSHDSSKTKTNEPKSKLIIFPPNWLATKLAWRRICSPSNFPRRIVLLRLSHLFNTIAFYLHSFFPVSEEKERLRFILFLLKKKILMYFIINHFKTKKIV